MLYIIIKKKKFNFFKNAFETQKQIGLRNGFYIEENNTKNSLKLRVNGFLCYYIHFVECFFAHFFLSS